MSEFVPKYNELVFEIVGDVEDETITPEKEIAKARQLLIEQIALLHKVSGRYVQIQVGRRDVKDTNILIHFHIEIQEDSEEILRAVDETIECSRKHKLPIFLLSFNNQYFAQRTEIWPFYDYKLEHKNIGNI